MRWWSCSPSSTRRPTPARRIISTEGIESGGGNRRSWVVSLGVQSLFSLALIAAGAAALHFRERLKLSTPAPDQRPPATWAWAGFFVLMLQTPRFFIISQYFEHGLGALLRFGQAAPLESQPPRR